MYYVLFISSWKSAGALATPKGMTFHLNTRPLRPAVPEPRLLGQPARSHCVCPFLVLYRHLAIHSRVFSMLGILPEWFRVFLLTSP